MTGQEKRTGLLVNQIQVFVLVLQKDLGIAFFLALLKLLFAPLPACVTGITRNGHRLDMAVPSCIRLRINHNGTATVRAGSDRFRLRFANIIRIIENAAIATVERLIRISLAFQGFPVFPVFQLKDYTLENWKNREALFFQFSSV